MDKKFILLVILLFSFLILSCSSNKETDGNLQQEAVSTEVVSGKIIVVGNEPFTKLALMVNDTTTYVLDASKEIIDELKMNQGYDYSVTYKAKKNAPEGVSIEVVEVKKNDK